MHNHGLWATDASERFEIYRSLHLGTRGPAGSEYIVIDTWQKHKPYFADTQQYVKCYLAYRLRDIQCAPFFGKDAPDGHIKEHDINFIKSPEWGR